jgi:hypothetical protein
MRALDEFIRVLDLQIDYLQQKRARMARLAECVNRADLPELQALLASESEVEDEAASLEEALRAARRGVGEELGVETGEMRLGDLLKLLRGADAIAVADRRERLLVLMGEVQEQSRATAALVRQALDFSGRLVSALTGREVRGTVYSSSGRVRQTSAETIVRHCV